MAEDLIAEQINWLDRMITHPENRDLFHSKDQLLIEGQLSNRWLKENRLDLLNDLSERFGEAEVLTVIDKIIYTNCKRDWDQAGKERDNSLTNFLKILWEPLKESGFDYSFKKEGNKTKFKVLKCPMFDLAQKIGAKKWLYHLVCLTDEPSMNGFNSKIEFTRTRTLMQGFPDCDHCYTDHSLE
jgi:predicted ArsR family transcriptional regulator